MRMYKHPDVGEPEYSGVYFDATAKRRKINPTETYDLPRAAKLLDVDQDLIEDLLADGVIPQPRFGRKDQIRGADLKTFVDRLEPVEVELFEVTDDQGDQGQERANAGDVPPVKPNGDATAKGKKLVAEAATAETAPASWQADCPNCGAPLELVGELERFKCPECGETLTVAAPTSAKAPAPAPTAKPAPRRVGVGPGRS